MVWTSHSSASGGAGRGESLALSLTMIVNDCGRSQNQLPLSQSHRKETCCISYDRSPEIVCILSDRLRSYHDRKTYDRN